MSFRVLHVSDPAVPDDELCARIQRSGPHGAVQLRHPDLSTRAFVTLARRLRRTSRRFGALLFVNDRLDVARLVEADGIHLGRRSVTTEVARKLFGGLVSRSAHSVAEAHAHGLAGADVVQLSPVFSSPGKGEPLGLEALTAARAALPPRCALVALGGVDRARADACLRAGADGVGSIRFDLSPQAR